MYFGLGHLRLSSKEFWDMTPRELNAAMGQDKMGSSAPDRISLETLMARYPDQH